MSIEEGKWTVLRALFNGEDATILIGAAAGGFISLLFLGEKITWKMAVGTLSAALATSYYGVRYAESLLHFDTGMHGLLGFVFGLLAFSAMSGLFKLLRQWREAPGEVLAYLAQYIPFLKRKAP